MNLPSLGRKHNPFRPRDKVELRLSGIVVVLLAKMQIEPDLCMVVPPLVTRHLPSREDLAVSRIRGRERAHV